MNQGQRKLAVVVEDYPYSTGEPFFHAELKKLVQEFDEIAIVCKHAATRKKNPPDFALPAGVRLFELNDKASFGTKLRTAIKVFLGGRWISIWRDIRRSGVPFNAYAFKVALAYIEASERMEKELRSVWEGNRASYIWYSYWCDDAAYMLARWQKNGEIGRSLCRVHNTDVYMERHPYAYLPFRKFIHENLSQVLPISAHAQRYLWNQTPRASSRILLSRLGVPVQPDLAPPERRTHRLLSLSKISPVKNIEGLIEALWHWDGEELEWHHFGQAPKSEYGAAVLRKMEALAVQNPRVRVVAHGFVPPADMMQRIRELNPMALINTSLFEGIPVSMMEVASLGIPVLGPRICGVPELVVDGVSGFLLQPEDPQSIRRAIQKLLSLRFEDYLELRRGSREIQHRFFQDEVNYARLGAQLQGQEFLDCRNESEPTDIGIVSVGTGNIDVWLQLFRDEGLSAKALSRAEQVESCRALVLPGVGHFDAAMSRLNEPELKAALNRHHASKKPILGVCLGMQCLMEHSEEGQEPGLGWIPGKVVSLKTTAAEQGLTWPHIGWDGVSSSECEALGRFYFTHGYACQAEDSRSISHECAFGQSKITVGLKAGHIQGFQFHPEKSHAQGRNLLREWLQEAGFELKRKDGSFQSEAAARKRSDTTLFVLARDFPFGVCEPYFAAELQVLAQRFQRIVVFNYHPGPRSEQPLFAMPANVEVVDVSAGMTLPNKFKAVLKSGLPHRLGRFLRDLPGPHLLGIKTALAYEAMAATLEQNVRPALKEKGLDLDSGVWYAYWTDHAAYMLALWMRRSWISVSGSRTHGSDMYAERHPFHYLPHRAFIFSQLTAIAVNSRHGLNYLKGRYPESESRFWLARLGVKPSDWHSVSWDLPIRLASLAALIPIKNLDLLLDVLEKWDGPALEWHHFGKQPDNAYTHRFVNRANAIQAKRNGLRILFHGYVAPELILDRLKELQVHALVNSSRYEGVPVSLMEGLSLGLPCIAPKIFGIPDVVENAYSGYLVEPEDKNSLAEALKTFAQLKQEEYETFREQARQLQEQRFLAETNYQRLADLWMQS